MPEIPPSDFEPMSAPAPDADPKSRIVDALMQLAAERSWEDISISDVAARAGVGLSEFRDLFPSKGAVLAAFSRRIDKIVLEGPRDDLIGEPVKERLFDVLMRRLDALAPYKYAIEAVMDYARREPLTAASLNRSALNSMRFMLEAAGVNSEGAAGAVKLQGLVLAWGRVLSIWIRDDEPGLARTMAALDRELTRGSSLVARVEDLDRIVSPLRSVARSLFERRRPIRGRGRYNRRYAPNEEGDDTPSAAY